MGAQDQISGLWDPGHPFRATGFFYSNLKIHMSRPVLPAAITRRSCRLRGHSPTWRRGRSPTRRKAASGVNREEPRGESKALEMR